MDLVSTIYWPAVLLAALANYLFGWLYFSPYVFGKCWAKATNVQLCDKPCFFKLIVAYLNSLLYTVGLFLACEMAQIKTPVESVQFACMLVVFFILPTLISSLLWNRRPLHYMLGALVYHLLSASIIAFSLTVIG
ncbi:MAG: hypothetical protein CMF48_02450 [Legionellales bacterium]|nr:hypothetical protein [Legionellales bacterium]|tara:strand:- start:6 stop:410 length:405 start_codon:yes stop_codon:yes gene_type:complete